MERGLREQIPPVDDNDTLLTKQELIERYAMIQKISVEQAQADVGGETEEDILKNIEKKTIEKINTFQPKLNRAQRRALAKKNKNKSQATVMNGYNEQIEAINETARKLSYIDLIQKLRALNERKQKENEENGYAIDEDS